MTETGDWPARATPFDGDATGKWDMTCRVTGGGCDMLITIGGISEKPTTEKQEAFKRRCIEQFPWFFSDTQHETAAVTVGPHRDDGDDDRAVG